MKGFFRPEALAILGQWRLSVFAALLIFIGLYIAFSAAGLSIAAGAFFVITGALLAHDEYRRKTFPSGSAGAGMVQVDERQITYLTAQGGSAVSLNSLERIELHHMQDGHNNWVFFTNSYHLTIPTNAHGNEALFDALVALTGIDYAQAQAANQATGADIFLIWQKDRSKLH